MTISEIRRFHTPFFHSNKNQINRLSVQSQHGPHTLILVKRMGARFPTVPCAASFAKALIPGWTAVSKPLINKYFTQNSISNRSPSATVRYFSFLEGARPIVDSKDWSRMQGDGFEALCSRNRLCPPPGPEETSASRSARLAIEYAFPGEPKRAGSRSRMSQNVQVLPHHCYRLRQQ